MAKVDTDAQAQAVQTLLGGLSLKRKQELIERNDRLRFQFLQKQKMSATKAREAQINGFLDGVVTGDKKMRELVFNAWIKDNATALGDVPEFPERFKRDQDAPTAEDDDPEPDVKEATAALKKWIKTSDADIVNAYARLGPYEFPAKALTGVKKPKAKDATGSADGDGAEGTEEGVAVSAGVSDAVVAEMRAELEKQREQFEAKVARAEDETSKFKRLLEENKDKRKTELSEAADKARQEQQKLQADWQRTEAQLRKEIAELNKSRSEAADKTSKVRDELLPLRQQLERAEKDAKRAQHHQQELKEAAEKAEEEADRLRDRIKALEAAQQQLVAKEKQLQKFERKGASVLLTASDNLKIWEESLNEQEVKEAFSRTFNLDTIAVSHFEHDDKDLHDIWKKLIAVEENLVERFFALPFDELSTPSDEFRELVTNFIELKDSLVAREQLAHLINFVGNRFLATLKQKV